jgi:dTDP-glucose 4,6-dehydratase
MVEHVHRVTNWNIVVLDKLSYASMGLKRLRDMELLTSRRIKVFTIDLSLPIPDGIVEEIGDVDYIIHLAAETHVDNSIKTPVPFVQNNINSTLNILEYARSIRPLKKFFYFSTDEVYGPALNGKLFSEDERHNPCNPYSASKSAAEQICTSYRNTYNIPIITVNVMNAFGERQHIEKYIPKVIKSILHDEKIYVHSYPNKQLSGSRFYIHARNIADAVVFLINHGHIGETYNINGEQEVTNLEIVLKIASIMKRPAIYEMVDFHSDRPGHDLRYGLDGGKLEKLGWTPPVTFEVGLEKCVSWTLKNQAWLEE